MNDVAETTLVTDEHTSVGAMSFIYAVICPRDIHTMNTQKPKGRKSITGPKGTYLP